MQIYWLVITNKLDLIVLEQVNKCFASQQVYFTDLAWHEGMSRMENAW